MALSRREFFAKTGTGALAMSLLASRAAALKASPLGLPIGSQTFPHRVRIQCGDLAGLLKDMKAAGIDVVEFCDPIGYVGANSFAKIADGKATRKLLDDHGMRAVSVHVAMPVYRNPSDFSKTIAWAQELGLEMLGSATLLGRVVNGATTLDEIKRAASEYNGFAERTKAAGMQQILHNEGFENSRLIDGRPTYPVLIEHLDPNLVKMQFQMSSMTNLGNPIMYFQNYPGRFASCHLQGVNTTAGMRVAGPFALPTKADPNAPAEAGRGGRGGAGGGRAGGGAATDPCAPAGPAAAPSAARGGIAPPAPSTGSGQAGQGPLALGEDTVNWPAVFAAAKTGGLRYAFIEQAWDATVKSAAYLKTLS
jgi:sugar phosphate isomerase/epimerase